MGKERWGFAGIVPLALLWVVSAWAVNLCTLTGNLTTIAGTAAINARVYFKAIKVQSYGGALIGPGSFSVATDSNGDLPAGLAIPQGAIVLVTIDRGQPVQVQIPLAASADLSTLILANSDPPSLVTGLNCAAGGDYTCSATNPSTGAVGTATIQPGRVTSLQGVAIGSVIPSPGQVLIQNSAATQWLPTTLTGDVAASVTTPGHNHFANNDVEQFDTNSADATALYGYQLDDGLGPSSSYPSGNTLIGNWSEGVPGAGQTLTGIVQNGIANLVLANNLGGISGTGATALTTDEANGHIILEPDAGVLEYNVGSNTPFVVRGFSNAVNEDSYSAAAPSGSRRWRWSNSSTGEFDLERTSDDGSTITATPFDCRADVANCRFQVPIGRPEYSASGTPAPTCNITTKGSFATVLDQNAASCTYGAPYSSGGGTVCPVFCSGSGGWVID